MQLKTTVLKFDAEAKVLEFEVEFAPDTELEHSQVAPLIMDGQTGIKWERAEKPNPNHLAARFVLQPDAIASVLQSIASESIRTPTEADLEPDPLKE